MEKDYIIRENEIGIKFIDGVFKGILKPGHYTFGIHPSELDEKRRSAGDKKNNFLDENFSKLLYVEPEIMNEIHKIERKLKYYHSSFLLPLHSFLTGQSPEDAKKLMKTTLRELKISAYRDNYDNVPPNIRNGVVELDKAITYSQKEPEIVVQVIDMRQLTLTVTGQEMLTNDKVSIRINVLVQYQVVDAAKAALSVVSYQDRLYQQVQMIVRDYAAANTLDQLLTNKSVISKYIKEYVKDIAGQIGLEVHEVGLKDIILPGEIRDAMNKVIQAEREAKAGFLKAREEFAIVRAMANASKIISSDPNIMRLKQIEALKDIAHSPSATIYFGVGDDLSKSLQIPPIKGNKNKSK